MCIYPKTRQRTLRDRCDANHTLYREVKMVRRHLALLVLALSTFALAACASPTAPKQSTDCAISAGSGICQSQ